MSSRNTKKKNRNEKFAGVVLALFVALLSFVYIVIRVAKEVHPILASIVNVYFIYTAFNT